MTFDLSKMRKHYATNKTNVSPTCMPSFIQTFTIVVEKRAFFGEIPNFFSQIIAPNDFWPSWKVIIIYIFGKPPLHTTTVPSFKFLWSIVPEKKAVLKFWDLFSNDYCPLWPLTFARAYQTQHFWKALIANYHHGTFQISVFNSVWGKCNVKVLGHFLH